MAAYVVVDVRILDAAKYDVYRQFSGKSLDVHQGDFLAGGGAIDVLEGDWQPQRLVIIRFDTMEAAHAWYDSPEYGAARAAREGAAIMKMIAVQGA